MKKILERVNKLGTPVVAGLDTSLEYLPENMQAACGSFEDAGKAVLEFNCQIIDAICGTVPAVKIQAAYYESYGWPGMRAFYETAAYAAKRGMAVIADVKRNDIGSTAEAYAKAYLSGVCVGGKRLTGFPADAVTVNAYLGWDGIEPFIKAGAEKGEHDGAGGGIFVLVKTSNKSGAQLQDIKTESGTTVYAHMAGLVKEWGAASPKYYGYNSVGAVVGATYPHEAAQLREMLPETLFLVPGYGAQGAGARELKVFFNADGTGALINNSRGVLLAYRKDFKGLNYYQAAAAACDKMSAEIKDALK